MVHVRVSSDWCLNVQNENETCLKENVFAARRVLKQRPNVTQEWFANKLSIQFVTQVTPLDILAIPCGKLLIFVIFQSTFAIISRPCSAPQTIWT